MSAKKIFLVIESVMIIISALLLGAAVVSIFLEGMAVRESEDVLAWIFTREKMAEHLGPLIPVLACTVILAIAGRVLGYKDENAEKPVRSVRMKVNVKGEVSEKRVSRIRIFILILAVVMIAAGIFNGSMRDVLVKAVNLCTECVGLG